MTPRPSLLDELRTEYVQSRRSSHEHADVEGFHEIDARMRMAFRWLEKAIMYLDGIKPQINHVFDLGHGAVFEAPRFGRGFVGQHTRRIVGFPVLDEVNIHYEIATATPLTIDVAAENIAALEKKLDAAACCSHAGACNTLPASRTDAHFLYRRRFQPRFPSALIIRPVQ